MPRLHSRLIAPLLLLLAVGACSGYRQSATPIPGFGNAVQQNNGVMIVDPHPANAANTQIDMDGRRALLAIERYRSGEVIDPAEPTTTEFVPFILGGPGGEGGDAGE